MSQQTDPSNEAAASDEALEDATVDDATEPATISDDPLADQIQEMLDASRQQQEAVLAQAVDAAGASEFATSEEDAADEDLESIDAQLASEADELLAGDFESVDEVIGSPMEEAAPEVMEFDPIAQTPPAAQAAAPSPVEDDELEIAGDFAAPDELERETDLPLPSATDAVVMEETADTDADIVAGDFHAPDEVAFQSADVPEPETPSAGDFTATAADIAAELDDESNIEGSFASVDDTIDEPAADVELPISAAQPPEAEPQPELVAAAATETVTEADAPAQRQPRIHVATGLLHKTCCVISKPVASINEEWRNIIGYAGVVTLFNFSVLMLYKLASTLLG